MGSDHSNGLCRGRGGAGLTLVNPSPGMVCVPGRFADTSLATLGHVSRVAARVAVFPFGRLLPYYAAPRSAALFAQHFFKGEIAIDDHARENDSVPPSGPNGRVSRCRWARRGGWDVHSGTTHSSRAAGQTCRAGFVSTPTHSSPGAVRKVSAPNTGDLEALAAWAQGTCHCPRGWRWSTTASNGFPLFGSAPAGQGFDGILSIRGRPKQRHRRAQERRAGLPMDPALGTANGCDPRRSADDEIRAFWRGHQRPA